MNGGEWGLCEFMRTYEKNIQVYNNVVTTNHTYSSNRSFDCGIDIIILLRVYMVEDNLI